MKTRKSLRWGQGVLWVIILCSSVRLLHPFSFDGRITPTYVDYKATLTDGDYINGMVFFTRGFAVAAGATVHLNLFVPVAKDITLGSESAIYLDNSLEIQDGSLLTGGSRGHIYPSQNLSGGGSDINATNIKTDGLDLNSTTLIVHVAGLRGRFIWDFSNKPVLWQQDSFGFGDYETEKGIFFKGVTHISGIVNLKNAHCPDLSENFAYNIPIIRFYGISSLQIDNMQFNLTTNYTLTTIWNGLTIDDQTSFSGPGQIFTLGHSGPVLTNCTFNPGLEVQFQNPFGDEVQVQNGPLSLSNTDLLLTTTMRMRKPQCFVDGENNVYGQNNVRFSSDRCWYHILPDSKLSFHDCFVRDDI